VLEVSHGINYSFSSLLKSWSATGTGQIMAERVTEKAVENYGVVDIGGI